MRGCGSATFDSRGELASESPGGAGAARQDHGTSLSATSVGPGHEITVWGFGNPQKPRVRPGRPRAARRFYGDGPIGGRADCLTTCRCVRADTGARGYWMGTGGISSTRRTRQNTPTA
jgi:hypothetical protein